MAEPPPDLRNMRMGDYIQSKAEAWGEEEKSKGHLSAERLEKNNEIARLAT